MNQAESDPYEVLGVPRSVTGDELRRVYRELVKRHHPDHNGGSPESTARFAAIQSAYAQLHRELRAPEPASVVEPAQPDDSGMEQRIADLEQELAARREAERRAQAVQAAQAAARQAAAYQAPTKPTREELGYYETDDSFGKILDDAGDELAKRARKSGRGEFTRRLTDLFGGRDG